MWQDNLAEMVATRRSSALSVLAVLCLPGCQGVVALGSVQCRLECSNAVAVARRKSARLPLLSSAAATANLVAIYSYLVIQLYSYTVI